MNDGNVQKFVLKKKRADGEGPRSGKQKNGVHAITYEKLPPEFKLSGPQSSGLAEQIYGLNYVL